MTSTVQQSNSAAHQANSQPAFPFSPDAQSQSNGLTVDPVFCPQDVADPFDTVQWETRTAAIKDESGNVLFEQHDAEVPAYFSQLATNVVVSKYFYGEVNTPERERSLRQLIHRVSRTVADWGIADGYFATPQDGERFYRDLTWLCLHQHGAFNSPVWFNVGLHHQYGVKGAACNWHWDKQTRTVRQPENPYEFPQASACFIQSVDDHMESIMELARSEAMLFKFGSGTGTDLSTIRSYREKLAGGGKPSGPLSFMGVYDRIASVVKSGGKTRRAAKMQSLKVWHPDIMDFIECKAKEERKARTLIANGYESNFNGEAYSSILYQNANLSVRVTDDFMQAAEHDQPWATHWVTDPNQPGPVYQAKELLHAMAENAWQCGDPGVQYDTTINTWHTCPNNGRINASNPCVTGDTLVATTGGFRRIDSLVGRRTEIITGNGAHVWIDGAFETGQKQIFELKTRSGYSLRVTADHKIQTINRGDVPASELTTDDTVKLGRGHFFGQEHLSEDLALRLGATMGQLANANNHSQAFHSDDRMAELCESNAEGGVATLSCLEISLQELSQELRRFATTDDDGQVCFTEEVFGLDSTTIETVLNALFKACGTTSDMTFESDNAVIHTANLNLLRQIQTLLLACNRKARISEVETSFGQTSNFKLEFSSNWSLAKDDFDSLTPCGEEDVYDLTEPTTHHFVANGIVVHNCSEYMFLDDTACNLSSVNLMKFRKPDGSFDVSRFQAACRVFFIAQEILVDHASYPTAQIAENSHLFRPLGLGYSNLGSLIMASGWAYDSPAALGLCGALTAVLHGAGNLASAEMAAAVGPFEGFDDNREPMLNVMQMHRDAVEEIDDACPAYLKDAARGLWDSVLSAGRRFGFRNAQATVLAPTGTISFLMDCDTTGIEPDIALVKYKQLAGGGMLKIVNRTVPLALETLGYTPEQIESIVQHVDEHDTIEGAEHLNSDHLPVFDCAFEPAGGGRSIPWPAHVRMMAAAQPFLSGAISKTVNMPRDSTPEDIAGVYQEGWRLGLKALAIYRDGSKESQPLSTSTEAGKAAAKQIPAPRRERLPDTRQSVTHKFSVAGHEGYVTVGLYEDGRPGELFITMAKEGSTVGGLMDCFGTAISINLQYGVPLQVLVNKFNHTRFEPMGHTPNPDIRIASSLVDYIFRWLGNTFLPGYKEANGNGHGETAESQVANRAPDVAQPHGTKVASNPAPADSLEAYQQQLAAFQLDAPTCDVCGNITVRAGNCYLCHNCGNSMGCS